MGKWEMGVGNEKRGGRGNWLIYKIQEKLNKRKKYNCITKSAFACIKTRNLEHTIQPSCISTGWRVSFQGNSVGLGLFQATMLVSVSSLPDSLIGVKKALSSSYCFYMFVEGGT